MYEGTIVWTLFFFFGSVIIFAGPRLSRYGDVIAEKTGLERSWIGVILLALVTSLPELATSTTAAALKLPDIVFGNVYGSNLFNVLIIAILDVLTPRPPILTRAGKNHIITSSFGIKMMVLSLVPLVLYNIPGLDLQPVKIMGIIDISSILLIIVYIVGMKWLYTQDHLNNDEEQAKPEPLRYSGTSTRKTYILFTLFALLIIGAGISMSVLADRISNYEVHLFGTTYEIGQSLVGIILLAVVTSLPEMMVSIGAVRLGAIDMAVGNVLGSNMFNMLIIGISDFFYPAGSILNRPTVEAAAKIPGLASILVVALSGIIMLGVVSSEIIYKKKRNGRISPSTPLLFAIFTMCYFLLFYIKFH